MRFSHVTWEATHDGREAGPLGCVKGTIALNRSLGVHRRGIWSGEESREWCGACMNGRREMVRTRAAGRPPHRTRHQDA